MSQAASEPRLCSAGLHSLPKSHHPAVCQQCLRDELASGISERVAREIGADSTAVFAIVVGAASTTRQLRQVAAFLRVRGSMAATPTEAPPTWGRIVRRMNEAGLSDIALPLCAQCGMPRELPYVVDGGRICRSCFLDNNAEACSLCGRVGRVATRTAAGAPICMACRQRDETTWQVCAGCGKRRRIAAWEQGFPYCQTCYTKPLKPCSRCGEMKPIHAIHNHLPVCRQCYSAPERECSVCGQVGKIAVRGKNGSGDVCVNCYRPIVRTCAACGRERPCHKTAEGIYLCPTCRSRSLRECVDCGRLRPVQAVWPDGPVCTTCYDARVRQKGVCTSCGQTRRIVTEPPEALCSACAGVEARYVCSECGQEDRLYLRGRCVSCEAKRRVDLLLRDEEGNLLEGVEGLYAALLSRRNPKSLIVWLRGKGAELLRQLISSGRAPTHADLDVISPNRQAAEYLRGLLVATGVLPPHGTADTLEQWIDALLSNSGLKAHQTVLATYCQWWVARRLRRRQRRGVSNYGSLRWAKSRILAALRFLTSLEADGIALSECAQAYVDAWLCGGKTPRYLIRDFIHWAARRRIAPSLAVPPRLVRSATQPIDQVAQEELARSLLEDEAIDIVDRVAGALAVVYAQHLSRVARLRVSDVEEVGSDTYLHLGTEKLQVQSQLGDLIRDLCRHPKGHAAVSPPDSQWLFPGGIPGQPMSAEHLRIRLAALGIHAKASRAAILVHIASEVPSSVFASLIGMHPNTAEKWVARAGGNWSRYVTLKSRLGE